MACVVAIVQARMGSTRLPGKSGADLGGRPVVERVLERVARTSAIDEVMVATTDLAGDDDLAGLVAALGYRVFRGSSDDVLSRYQGAAAAADAEVVVRITSDCPFVDPDVVDAVVGALDGGRFDYATNTLVRTYPLGLDAEAFTRDALETAHREAVAPHEREHVTPFIYQHPERFRLTNVVAPDWATRPDWRLTVDTSEDLEFARALYARLAEGFLLADVIAVVEKEPVLLELNGHVAHRHVEKPTSW